LTLPIQVFKDYDKSVQSSSFDLNIVAKTSDSRWGTAKWDDADEESAYVAKWDSIAYDLTADIVNLPTLGTAKSISMKVSGPSTDNHWEVNALAFTYTPRRLR
jgi:hypothetical protein